MPIPPQRDALRVTDTTTECQTGLEPEKTTACPQCGGRDLKIGAIRYAQAYVTFTPDGEHELEIKHGDTEWEDGSPARCLGCDFQGVVGDFWLSAEAVPRPVTRDRIRALGEQPGGPPFLFGEATEFLELWQADHPARPPLADAILREQMRAFLGERENWAAACDDLKDCAADAEPSDDLGYGESGDA